MNQQQIINKLGYIAGQLDDINQLRSSLFSFLADLVLEGVTEEKTLRTRSFPDDMREAILIRDNFTCVYCNRKGDYELDPDGEVWNIDHIIAYSRGGPTCLSNGVSACRKCNGEKGSMTPVEYLNKLRSVKPEQIQEPMFDDYYIESFKPLSSYDDMAHFFFKDYPHGTQAQLRVLLSAVNGKEPDSYKAIAHRLYHARHDTRDTE